ncbi:MAG TPA: hypothetical protein VMB05_05350 [Solirubrobacteraceae bacterium]|nr:hypothetical protein [Solirubrobacteraceae bacterium]
MNVQSAISAQIGTTAGPGITAQPTTIEPGTPAQVRAGDPKAKQAYATALQFEQILVGELSQSLVQGSGLEGGGGEGLGGEDSGGEAGEGGGANPLLASLVPQALSESIMRGGGLGLAGSLTRSLDPQSAQGASPEAAQSVSPEATPGVSAEGVSPGTAQGGQVAPAADSSAGGVPA